MHSVWYALSVPCAEMKSLVCRRKNTNTHFGFLTRKSVSLFCCFGNRIGGYTSPTIGYNLARYCLLDVFKMKRIL